MNPFWLRPYLNITTSNRECFYFSSNSINRSVSPGWIWKAQWEMYFARTIHPKIKNTSKSDRRGQTESKRQRDVFLMLVWTVPLKWTSGYTLHVWTVNTEQSPLLNYLCDNFMTVSHWHVAPCSADPFSSAKKHVSTDHFSYRRFSMFL